MTLTHTPALTLQPAALPFALSDLGWILIAAGVMLGCVMLLGALGRRRRARARALNAVQRGTSGS